MNDHQNFVFVEFCGHHLELLQPLLTLAKSLVNISFFYSVSKKAKAASLQTTQRGIGIPSNWEIMDNTYKRVPLSPDAGGMIKMEYEEVAEKFRKTMKQATIVQIERVQNKFCWETFQV